MDPVGWVFTKMLEPPVRTRMGMRTGDAFVPRVESSKERDIANFDREQDRLIDRIRESEGLKLNRLKIRSPFDARVRYNLYAAYRLIAAHQRRHLWQADRVLEEIAS